MKVFYTFVALLLFAGAAPAQTQIYSFQDGPPGFSVAGVGDVTGDGTDDVVGGGPSGDDMCFPINTGAVYIFNGGTAETAYVIHSSTQRIGWFETKMGDVNGDGINDFAYVGPAANFDSPFNDSTITVVVRGGDFGAQVQLGSPGDYGCNEGYGWSLDGGGDANADGVPELLTASLWDKYRVASGADGSTVLDFSTLPAGARIRFIGDIDGDGNDDIILNVLNASQVRSGATGNIIFTIS